MSHAALAMDKDYSGLVEDLKSLYAKTKSKMGAEDIRHVEKIHAYSTALKTRSSELLKNGGSENAFRNGVVLYMLHTLLEFSELGHSIMHGGYDDLPNAEKFHSDSFIWDFVVDPSEWKTMHHQNHHPFTNIIDKDHDLGYSILRFYSSQSWYGHHAVQPFIFSFFLALHTYHFSWVVAISAARTRDEKVLSVDTFKKTFGLIKTHFVKNFIKDPLDAKPSRILPTLFGNYLGSTLGYDLLTFILLLEHHAPNVKIFADTGDNETEEQYFLRQIYATTNFTPSKKLDDFLKEILDKEVDFKDPPNFEVFYGGLNTHLEHHLFPDLPCNRQREIVPEVKALLAKHDLPYNMIAFEDATKHIFKSLVKWVPPLGDNENSSPLSLLKKPSVLLKRVKEGFSYKKPSLYEYFNAPRFYNVPAKVIHTKVEADGQALAISLEKPKGWEQVVWDAGSYISVKFEIDGQSYVRQYSLTSDSSLTQHLNIAVKSVKDGIVSNHIVNTIKVGDEITLVGVPQNEGGFYTNNPDLEPVYIAGGVGITPMISLIRQHIHKLSDKKATLIYFNRNPKSIIFYDEIKEIEAHYKLKVHFIWFFVEVCGTPIMDSSPVFHSKIECCS